MNNEYFLRALMHLVQSYHEYFECGNNNLYGSKKVKVTKPELYVTFTKIYDEQVKLYGHSHRCIAEVFIRMKIIKRMYSSCKEYGAIGRNYLKSEIVLE